MLSTRNRAARALGALWAAPLLISLACGGAGGGGSQATAPAITAQPQPVAVLEGQPATFGVAATGAAPLAYQWRKDGTALSGATSATFTLAAAQPADAGDYTVVVSNPAGGVTSQAATLTVNVPPAITTQPQDQAVAPGQPAAFTVAASGTGSLACQWYKDGSAIGGATAFTYQVAAAGPADTGAYHAVVTSPYGTATSAAAQLTLTASGPVILAQPQTATALPPDPVTFTVSAQSQDGGALSYAWKKNGVAIPGATSAAYTVPSTELATNSDAYSVTVSEGALSVDSATVYALASVPTPTYAGDPVPVPSRPITVLPSYHTDAVAYPKGSFRLGYDESLKDPVWSVYMDFPVHQPYANSKADYAPDPRLDAPQVGKNDYTGIYTGGANYPDSYDRGHMSPRADVSYRYTPVAGDDATIMSNLVPQISQLNQQTWSLLEQAIGGTQGGASDGLTSTKGRLWIYTGPVFTAAHGWWDSRVTPGLRIAIPDACYKIVVHETSPGHPEVLAMLLPNAWGLPNSASTLTWYVTSVARIEALTGLDFFPDLATVAPGLDIAAWKAGVDVRGWGQPFEQASGPNVHMVEPSYDETVDQGATLTFQGAFTPNSASPAGTTVTSETWSFGDGTPTENGAALSHTFSTTGTFSVAFTATDSLGASNTITRVVRVVPPASANSAPTTTPSGIPDQSVVSGLSLGVQFTVDDDRTLPGSVKVSASADDAVLLPAGGITAVNASGAVTLNLTPAAGHTGSTLVTVILTDGDGLSATRTFTLTVTAPPANVLTEPFESGTKTSYAVGTVAFPTGAWTLDDALVGTSASDHKNGLQCLRVRNGKVTMGFDWPNGAQTVTVYHAAYGSDAASTWQLWYSTDGGGTWTQTGSDVVSSGPTLTQASFAVNVAGPIRFEIRKTAGGTARFNVDDFQINGY